MTVATKPPPDWNAPREAARQPGYMAQRVLAIAVTASLVALYFVVAVETNRLGLLDLGVAVAAVLVFLMTVRNQSRFALLAARAKLTNEDDEPRLWNVVGGLAGDLGVRMPAIYVVEDGGPNALVCRSSGRPAIAFTRSLLDSFTRTELEAVGAHCLVRLASGDIQRASLGLTLGPLGSRAIPLVGTTDDIRAAAATRFPPALISAISKAEARGGIYDPFWFVGAGRAHRSVDERIATLQDL